MYIVYSSLLSADTLYGRNRFYILASVLCAFILPAITLHTARPVKIPLFQITLSEVLISMNKGSVASANHAGLQEIAYVASVIYLAGLAVAGVKMIFDICELVILIIRHKITNSNIIRFTGLNTAGFSALGFVFVNSRLGQEETGEIIRHEQNHLDNYHFFDIIFVELTKAFQWFNPIIYLFDKSLRAVHEYQADESCLNAGIPVIKYQRILLNQLFKSNIFTITNSFSNPSLIRKRMIMMTKQRSRTVVNLKLLSVFPAVAFVMFAFSSCVERTYDSDPAGYSSLTQTPAVTENEGRTAIIVDKMPEFRGGNDGLMKFISSNTIYPETARNNGISGKVLIRFRVRPDGRTDNIRILQGADPDLDKEAIRVISILPAFEKPAYKNGRPVSVWFKLPISFRLN